MEFNTKFHGIINFNEKDIVTFHKGLPGFEKLRKFVVIPIVDNEFFQILHSIEDEEIGFVVVSPFDVEKDYEFKIEDDKLEALKIKEPGDVNPLCMVTLNSNSRLITSNLKAPIIINITTKLGEQIILDNEKYKIKHPLFKEGWRC